MYRAPLKRGSAGLYHRNALVSTRFSRTNRFRIARALFCSSRLLMGLAGESKHQRSSYLAAVGANISPDTDPYNYTSGRWLRQDALQQSSRNVRFNFDALRRRVVALCPDVDSITSYDKKEGGFNRVFVFHTENGKHVVARIPFPVAGPQRMRTNSEVATIQFLQARTSIPIPKILEWSDDPANAVGSEYIIMEHAPGISLHEIWSTMDVGDQIRCVQAICEKLSELVDLEFPAYGSLYFANTPYLAAQKLPLDREFCIGPHCGAMYWDCNIGQSRYYHNVIPNQGPWLDLAAYCNGLIDSGISRLPHVDLSPQQPRYRGSVRTHCRLLKHGRAVLSKMVKDPRIQRAATPTIFHPDLHKRNIFVSEEDPTIVTAIIDWQSSSITPAFWYADEVPDFAQPIPDPLDEERTEPRSEACAKAFDACFKVLAPKLASVRSMDASLFRPFLYCHRTWEDGAVAFHEELIQTSLHWRELGLEDSCPFPLPSPDELTRHQKDYRLFEASHQLRHSLSGLLNIASDGWVPSERWEATELAHRGLFAGMLREVLSNEQPDDDEPIRDEEDLKNIWPFDLKP